MIGGVTRRMLPHLSGVPHLYVNGPLKWDFALLQTLSRLFHLVQFVKCWQFFLELNSKKESRCVHVLP